jgi:hypothetical protein
LRKEADVKRFCGNCTSHNMYEYPLKLFCTKRFLSKKDPIVDTLWHCEDWYENAQHCHCVEEAQRIKNGQ